MAESQLVNIFSRPSLEDIGIPKLFKHQEETIERLKYTNIFYDMSEPGTGKTRTHAEAFERTYRGRGDKLLVLAPKTLVETAWEADFRKFLPDLAVQTCLAPARNKKFEKEADVYITNIDAATWLAKQDKKFFSKFGSLIIDEVTAFKHPESNRSKAIWHIVKQGYFDRRTVLSGTAYGNSILELWNPTRLLDYGRRLGKIYSGFRDAVTKPQLGPYGVTGWENKPGAEAAVAKLLADISIRHLLDECADIPSTRVYQIGFDLEPKAMKVYEQVKRDMLVMLEEGKINAVNAAVLHGKLLQVASGAVYTDRDPAVLSTARNDLVLDLVEARKRSVVFFNWRHQRDGLLAEAKKRKIEYALIDGTTKNEHRTQIVDDFQCGNLQALFLHPKTGAHGLTLTAAKTIIWTSPRSEGDLVTQGAARIRRISQTKKTEMIWLVANGTLEAQVIQMAGKRMTQAEQLYEVLK